MADGESREALWNAHWSGDPRRLREAIEAALAAGMTVKQVAAELSTTKRRVKAAISPVRLPAGRLPTGALDKPAPTDAPARSIFDVLSTEPGATYWSQQ